MSEIKQFTSHEVSDHNESKDLYIIIHNKVYDCSSWVENHPGGKDVILDLAGQDGTDSFEDVGHSSEARDILNGLYVGNVKRTSGDPSDSRTRLVSGHSDPSSSTKSSTWLFTFVLICGVFGYMVSYHSVAAM